jgi:ADP-heptose:LPS heptosyltransferase
MKLLEKFTALIRRHAQAFGYVLTEVLPIMLRTGRRPVIFSRFAGMGDIICTLPAALELKQRHVGATFIYNCSAHFADVPRLGGVANRVTSLKHVGTVGHWYAFLLGGFYHFAHGDDTPGKVAQEPMVAEFLRQFSLPVNDAHPALAATPQAVEKVRRLLAEKKLEAGNLVLIHAGPSWTVKEWPPEKWAQLVVGLRQSGCTSIAQVGTGYYQGFLNVAGKTVGASLPGVVSLVDALTVEECVAVIAQARLFIGIDSGLLHIAAAARTAAVGIFGSTSPEYLYSKSIRDDFVVTRVECAGCFHRQPRIHWFDNCPYDIRCMKTVEVDAVLQKCLLKLRANPAPGRDQKHPA